MNQKQFRYAMNRGLGRCILAARQNPEPYRKLVIWACGHPTYYDAQCEGSRAWYIYQLVSCFDDRTAFLEAAVQQLRRPNLRGWDVLYFTELIECFALDGSEEAKQVLWEKYLFLFSCLWNRKRAPRAYDFTRESFENISIALSGTRKNARRIAGDMGALYEKQKHLEGAFEWFYDNLKSQGFPKAPKSGSENLERFLSVHKALYEEERRRLEDRKNDPEREKRLEAFRAELKDLSHWTTEEMKDLILGYTPDREAALAARLRSYPVKRRGDNMWHAVQMDVLHLFDDNFGIQDPPTELLYNIYESTLCSCCRGRAARYLAERNRLTPEMLEELPFDSNPDNQELVEKMGK